MAIKISYKANKTSWLTSNFFNKYLNTPNENLEIENRNIFLF